MFGMKEYEVKILIVQATETLVNRIREIEKQNENLIFQNQYLTFELNHLKRVDIERLENKIKNIMDMLNLFMGQNIKPSLEDKTATNTFQQKEIEDENKLLKEKLLQAEEKIRQLQKDMFL
jgi:hypothetical protein